MGEPCADTRGVEVVRELAARVAAIAASAENARILQRWRDVNALRRPDRAPVWCRPVSCWTEILPEESLVSSHPVLRHWEREFRKILHKNEIGDDSPVAPYAMVYPALDIDPPNLWGVEIGRHRPAEAGGAWGYDPPIREEADLEKLRMPTMRYDPEETRARRTQLEEILGGALPVEVEGVAPLSCTIGKYVAELRGLEPMMLDMIAEPQIAHRLTAYVRDAVLAGIDAVEEGGAVTPSRYDPMTCSDPVGPPAEAGRHTFKNRWIMANSQEYDQVSPQMWEEFCLDYQRPLFERFGLVAYGCCENLTRKLDGVLTIPNLRIVTCSAWTDLDKLLDRLDDSYVIMWRQKASDVVFPEETATIRRDLEEGARRLQGRYYQIVLRELETLRGHADRLHVWADIAMEMAAKYA